MSIHEQFREKSLFHLAAIVFLSSLALFSHKSHAGTGVGLVYASTLAQVGGNGGNAWGANFTCPSGQLISGFNFWNQNTGGSLDGLSIQARCSTLTVSGTSVNLTYAGNTSQQGAPGGTQYSGSCPANQVATGVYAQGTSWPVLGWFRLYCAPISYNSSTGFITIQPGTLQASTIGPGYAYGGPVYNVNAPSGQALGGFTGRSGAALDQVSFLAYTITQSSLTLNATVTGGTATASSFTLRATDTSNVVANFTSGQTQVMVPRSYTLSGTGPAGYVLSSVTNCANPVVLGNGSSANCTLNFTYQPSISGTVVNDPAGNLTTTTGISSATVKLYNSAGTFITSTTTNASGAFTFTGLSQSSTYYVSVASAAAREQTGASPGTGNSGTAGGSGYGPICVTNQPTYQQQSGTTASSWNALSGSGFQACYGGRRGAVADANGGTTLTNDEHVTRVVIAAENVTDLQFSFSPSVVTNTNDSGQGSLRQFFINANAGLTKSMRFVPALAANVTSGSNSWWRTALSSAGLPVLTGANGAGVTIDGTAYSNSNGTTALNVNSTVLQAAQSVGYGSSATTIGPVNGSTLEVNAPGTSTFSPIMGTNAANTTIQNLSVTGGHNFGIWAGTGSSGFLLQNTAIGVTPGGTNSLNTYSASYGGGLRIGDLTNAATTSGITGTIQNNVINSNSNDIYMFRVSGLTSGQYVIQKNFLLGTGTANINAVDINGSPNVQFLSNYVTSGSGGNVYFSNSSTGGTITGNTVLASKNGPNIMVNSSSGAQVIGNLVQSAAGYGIRSDSSTNGLYQRNLVTDNTGGAIAVTVSGGNQITQNIYGSNGRNAIDLNSDGVSLNSTACLNTTGSGSGNGGLARPVINTATLSGTTLTLSGTMCATGTYTIEVYQSVGAGTANGTANNDMGADNNLAGEGTVYLGSLTAQSGGVFSGTITGVSLTNSNTISATAIRTVTGGTGTVGDTSEFAANFNFNTISGTVFEDVVGNQGAQVGLSGVKVCAFLDNGDGIPNNLDSLQQCTTTATDGTYSLSAGLSGTYWLAVQASTVLPSQGGTGLAEQVYGPVGGQCINSSYAQTTLTTAGPCYGGKTGNIADGFTGTVATLTNAQHISRVTSGSTSVTNQNFGFSFNVVTNLNDTGQGSLRQFITNANTVTGANAMRFVPAVAANITSGSNSWWQITPGTTGYPTLTGANAVSTTIDGTAYSHVDGTTILNTNTTVLGDTTTQVGRITSALSGVNGPELEIKATPSGAGPDILTLSATGTTIRNIGIYGGRIFISGATTTLIEKSILGVAANSVTDLGSGVRTPDNAISIGNATGTTIQNNLFAFVGAAGVDIAGGTITNLTLQNNEFRACGTSNKFTEGFQAVSGVFSNLLIDHNLFRDNNGYGIDYAGNTGGGTVTNNTITNNGLGGNSQNYGIRWWKSDNAASTIQNNIITNNVGGGIAVVNNASAAAGTLISQNIYGSNALNAIDLGNNGVTINTDVCTNANTATSANSGLARPVINSASLSGTTLTVSGTMCATGTFTLEVYKAVGSGTANGTANNDMGSDNRLAGEGTVYLGSITGQTGGTFSGSITGVSLSSTDSISAVAIRTTASGLGVVNDTSEFAANVGFGTISGIVFEDVAGNQGAQVPRSGAKVCGFIDDGDGIPNATDIITQCVTTASDGSYSLSAGRPGTFWVVVQASTLTPSQGGSGLAEQVYGPIGGQCIGSNYTGVTTLTAAGPCYGGKTGNLADGFAATAATLANAQHISKVTYSATNITNQNFGFSFNVVTNTNDSGQGSLRQFITNANGITGANTMYFVPAVAANQTSGSQSWWRTSTTTSYPAVTGASTTIDGTAHSYSNGVTVLNTNNVILGDTTTQVGRTTAALSGLNAPEFEVVGTGGALNLFQLNGASPVIQNMGIVGGQVYLYSGATSALITNNLLGTFANSFSDPGAAARSEYLIISDPGSALTGLTVTNNLLGYAGYSGISLNNRTHTDVTISNNELTGNGIVSNVDDALQVVSGGLSGTSTVNHNLFKNNRNKGIEFYLFTSPISIVNNTFTGGGSTTNQPAVSISKTANNLVTIQNNIITNNANSGIWILNSQATMVSQNTFGGNGQNAIDLNGDKVTLNTNACTNALGSSSANSGLARPVIKAGVLEGNTLTVEGTVCSSGTYTIEIYQAAGAGTANGTANNDMGADNQLAGEGTVYLGSLTATDGAFRGSLTVSGLTVGSSTITATAIRSAGGIIGDTSEFSANFTVTNPNFGSAPDSYKTLKASGGAQHVVYTGLSLGTLVPTSSDASPVTAYNPASGGDSITLLPFPQLTLGTTTYSVTIHATNLTSESATLVGWIDFNRNGTFDAAEGRSVTIPAGTNNGSFTLTWNSVQDLLNLSNPSQGLGPTYARFRLSTSSALTTNTPAGSMPDGEVEDYGGTGVLEIIGRDILGTVFDDANENGLHDITETGTGLTLYAKQVSYNGTSCVGPAIQAVAVDPTSGNYHIVGAAPGRWCVIISANNTLSDVTPYTPPGWFYTLNNPGVLIVPVTANLNQEDQNFGLSNHAQMHGTVFYDIGSGTGTAYNGTQDGTEVGVENATVQISYGSGQTATATTNAQGQFTLAMPVTTGTVTFSVVLPDGTVSVSKATMGYTDSAAATAYNSITLDASTVVAGSSNRIRFGLSPVASLEQNTIQAATASSIVYHSHTFTAESPGIVTFSYSDQEARPANPPWSVTLYQDVSCTGVLNTGDMPITAPITVTLGQQVCVISVTNVPAGALPGFLYTQHLDANFVYRSGSNVTVTTSQLQVNETTNVTDGQQLQLIKTVDKTSAKPGEILTYTIVYRNLAAKPINDLVIYDDTAPYTSYVAGSAQCVGPIPTGMTCTVTTDLDSNNQGLITWTFSGLLRRGISGTVTYQLMVLP